MAASVLVGFLASRVGASAGRDLRGRVFHKVVGFSNHEFNQFSTASLITRSTNDIQQIQMTGKQGISLGTLGNRIRIQFGDFKVRDYGFSQFKQYIQSFPNVELIEDGERTRAVYVED